MSKAVITNEIRNLEGVRNSIANLEITIGSDWADSPAVWTWLVLEDTENNSKARARVRDIVRNKIRNVARRKTGNSWQPYVRFRSASE